MIVLREPSMSAPDVRPCALCVHLSNARAYEFSESTPSR